MNAYVNYDFIPGEKIIFEDDFRNKKESEFPAEWSLKSGKGVVQLIDNVPAFLLTDGHYAKVIPSIKNDFVLTDSFTIEFDFDIRDGAYTPAVFFPNKDGSERLILWGPDIQTGYFTNQLSGKYPEAADKFYNKWHHAALAYLNGQIKCYIDQYLVLTIPKCGFQPTKILFGGLASPEIPLAFTNVKIATGGGNNMADKILADGKWMTHGITFDDNTSNIKPESMGVMNAIVKVMKENPQLNFQVCCYTESEGDESANMKLSDQRARAVKMQFVAMGIDASRLLAKGYGAKYPIDSSSTSEGRANNNRIELKLVK
ncbi:MAG: OmpA family protein [Saprospiraceae bacterium]|uniref:OmpA family protein n=1 Tax=Candidatus Opimibacter skivensis TaxID=2982028 RepID=A0A9D7XMM9_9BACT|nr:OmpA family protein [Candidatus Opimibacter skivensis]